eukprot:TRINITY_DN5050_c0_g1_i1.p1 TRINITY_DN5050_c0_g1~~TRINITY_DN5050_c0_g1_i1.p1  ORF type:complete len:864 (+),score=209.38 TRINITY_DN5050_c0_g1_i1:36-2627(+)
MSKEERSANDKISKDKKNGKSEVDLSGKRGDALQQRLPTSKRKDKGETKKEPSVDKRDDKAFMSPKPPGDKAAHLHAPGAGNAPVTPTTLRKVRPAAPKHEEKYNMEIDKRALTGFLETMKEWERAAQREVEGAKTVREYTEACSQELKNHLLQNAKDTAIPARILEIAHLTSLSISEHKTKAQDLLVQNTNSYHLCGNVRQIVSQFLEVFIRFYHTLAAGEVDFGQAPAPGGGYRDFVLEEFKEAYEGLEAMGWSQEEEGEVYGAVPFKTDFPPGPYRSEALEEVLAPLKSEERVSTLSGLLKRFQAEYALRISALSFPSIDVSNVLNKAKMHNVETILYGLASNTLESVFNFNTRGGNLFSSTRAALCFLMHAQTVLDVICKMPMFGPLVENTAQNTRHVLNLLKNIQVASGFVKGQEESGSKLEQARQRLVNMSYDCNKTIYDMMKDLEAKKMIQHHPRTDIVYTLIGMFFDGPLKVFKSELEQKLEDTRVSLSPFFTTSLQYAPLFLHQDPAFLEEYFNANPNNDYAQYYTQSDKKKGNKKISESTLKYTSHLLKMHPMDTKDKAQLLSSFLRLNSSPDHVLPSQSTSEVTSFDFQSLNYIQKRTLSTSSLDQLFSTARVVNTFARPFLVPPTPKEVLPTLPTLLDRYVSILLGYPRALDYSERLETNSSLSEDSVIPFLFRNKQAICDPTKAKDVKVLGFEYEFSKSPLVNIVFKIAQHRPKPVTPPTSRPKTGKAAEGQEIEEEDATTIIDKLYALWEASKTNGTLQFHQYLIQLITSYRYEDVQVKEALKKNVENAEEEVKFWVLVEKQVEAFISFLRKYDVALKEETPFSVLLCPTSNPDTQIPEEDAQLPQEVF